MTVQIPHMHHIPPLRVAAVERSADEPDDNKRRKIFMVGCEGKGVLVSELVEGAGLNTISTTIHSTQLGATRTEALRQRYGSWQKVAVIVGIASPVCFRARWAWWVLPVPAANLHGSV